MRQRRLTPGLPSRSVKPQVRALLSGGVALAALMGGMPIAGAVAKNASQQDSPRILDTSAFAPVVLDWKPCQPESATDVVPDRAQCAVGNFPLDYTKPQGPTTPVHLIRVPASDPAKRIGVVMLNPGGPGGSGVTALKQSFQPGRDYFGLTPEVRERFDAISFDPRMTSRSDHVRCFDSAEEEEKWLTSKFGTDSANPANIRRTLSWQLQLSKKCHDRGAERIAQSSTANVARDMDMVRAAMGEEHITYVGYSYGTFLGATYAKLFPNRVRAMVLDGALQPERYVGTRTSEYPLGLRSMQGMAANRTFLEFQRLCDEAGKERCPLAGDAAGKVKAILSGLQQKPVTLNIAGKPITIGYTEMVQQMFFSMYHPLAFAPLAANLAAIEQAQQAPAKPVELTADGATLRAAVQADKPYDSVGQWFSTMCADTWNTTAISKYPALADEAEKSDGAIGRLRATLGSECWSMRRPSATAYLGPWQQELKIPVLVIGTTLDPATAFEMTAPLAASFPAARNLTVNGYGHTMLAGRSSCAVAAAGAYLLTVDAPQSAQCGQDVKPFVPPTRTLRVEDLGMPASSHLLTGGR